MGREQPRQSAQQRGQPALRQLRSGREAVLPGDGVRHEARHLKGVQQFGPVRNQAVAVQQQHVLRLPTTQAAHGVFEQGRVPVVQDF